MAMLNEFLRKFKGELNRKLPVCHFLDCALLHCVTIKHIYLTPYVCNERFCWPPTIHEQQNILGKTLTEVGSSHLCAFLAYFASKLVNHSSHSEILNFHKISKLTPFSFKISDFTVFGHISKTYCVSKNWPILTQNMPKEAQRKDVSYQLLLVFFLKYFVVHEWSAVKKIVHYIRMK